jgi:hypothetical protein
LCSCTLSFLRDRFTRVISLGRRFNMSFNPADQLFSSSASTAVPPEGSSSSSAPPPGTVLATTAKPLLTTGSTGTRAGLASSETETARGPEEGSARREAGKIRNKRLAQKDKEKKKAIRDATRVLRSATSGGADDAKSSVTQRPGQDGANNKPGKSEAASNTTAQPAVANQRTPDKLLSRRKRKRQSP